MTLLISERVLMGSMSFIITDNRRFEKGVVIMCDKTYSFRLWYQVLTDESQRGSAMLLHRVSDKDRPQPKIPLPFSRKEFDVFAGVYFRSPQGMHSWMLVCLSCGDHSWIDPLYCTGVCSKCSSKARPRVRR